MPTETSIALNRAEAAGALAALGAECHRRGWAPGTGGNYSLVLQRDPLRLLITASGVSKGALRAADFVEVDADGRAVGGDGPRPSAETAIHVLLARQAGAGAVLHTHSVWATVLSREPRKPGVIRFEGLEMLKALSGLHTHDTTASLYILPNTQDMAALARELAQRLDGEKPPRWGFLLAGHGLYAWGRDLAEAERHLEALEFLLEVEARTEARRATEMIPF